MRQYSSAKEPPIDQESLRIAVLGCGSIGRRHIENLKSLGYNNLVALDPVAEMRQAVESELGVRAYESLDEIWQLEPRIALVTAPSSMHVDLAKEAARHNCHLFIEKPLANSVDGLRELRAEVDRLGLITMVGCNMRFHPGPARVKSLLNDGAIGRLLFARVFGGSYLPDWRPWQDYRRSYSANRSLGGGCILDGIHEIDLAVWYLGAVKSVVALASQISDLQLNQVEDVASLVLQHAGGQHSEVHLDYVQRVRLRGCVIVGTEGTVTWEWSDHSIRLYREESRSWEIENLPAWWEVNTMYLDEMRHFLNSVAYQQPTCNPIGDAIKVTVTALAAKQASTKRRFVDVGGYYHDSGFYSG